MLKNKRCEPKRPRPISAAPCPGTPGTTQASQYQCFVSKSDEITNYHSAGCTQSPEIPALVNELSGIEVMHQICLQASDQLPPPFWISQYHLLDVLIDDRPQ
eukprot:GHVU01067094.1.p1 GENE.GHVU01067094.1~~GHVU01067094.1.p1  ORF type:complete len:102 (-),score=5.39 GHVU01067094.1:142-447(-)